MTLLAFKVLLGLIPVLLFLAGLVFLDSYKLVTVRAVLVTILVGCVAAATAAVGNTWFMQIAKADFMLYSRYFAPVVEETLKAAYLIYLLKSNKIGFMVDAAILGFAVGTGFALVENTYYFLLRPDASPYLWVIRGFGTAVMHGGATALVAILAQGGVERTGKVTVPAFLPAVSAGVVLHSLYNHFFLDPMISTLIILIVFPAVVLVAFRQSEQATRKWLGVGFDSDRELLDMITTGALSDTRIGKYLDSLEHKFPGAMIADMLCYLRLHLELSIEAKGLLLLREAGFQIPADKEAKEKFSEIHFLQKSIGKTGILALHPFLHTRTKDLWQITMLEA